MGVMTTTAVRVTDPDVVFRCSVYEGKLMVKVWHDRVGAAASEDGRPSVLLAHMAE